ncbi:leukocyte elastase inhibitor-like [Saccostrea echinata]|uniref:leukocyte elastase inhibitor-like n=1 Tax=Saccostrea echinata TaxID=191078 RepID=UPI002A810FEF|nr:leukocyte elastase inhibitor-like [Saccostrea echinata]
MSTVLTFPNKEVSAAFSRANRGFMLSLLKHFPSESNIFYSPFSISTALAMVHMGAKADTRKEMSRVLHFEEMDKTFHAAFGSYLDYLSKDTGDCTLKTANRIYQSMRFKPEESFLQNCNKHFKASVESVDFSKSAVTSKKINSWVSQQTENKIQDLIPASALNERTFMVLVNAIYFKGNWNSKFESKHTQIMEFQNNKEKFMTDMMYQTDDFRFCQMWDLRLSALELPYEGKTLSLLILLPTAVDGIESLEKSLTESVLKTVVSNMSVREVNVYLPKFKMKSNFELKSNLSAMGMPSAFDMDKADFTGMDKDKNVYINAVFHNAFVEVNEEGTEAAASTGPVSSIECITPTFQANHPFLFFIRDYVNDIILFAGRFFKPSGASAQEEV